MNIVHKTPKPQALSEFEPLSLVTRTTTGQGPEQVALHWPCFEQGFGPDDPSRVPFKLCDPTNPYRTSCKGRDKKKKKNLLA